MYSVNNLKQFNIKQIINVRYFKKKLGKNIIIKYFLKTN